MKFLVVLFAYVAVSSVSAHKCFPVTQVEPICPANEAYQSCGTACPRNCENYKKESIICTKQCVQGCFCKSGYIRGPTGVCIKPEQCPATVCSDVNEEYKTCGTACQQTCDNIKRGIALACIDLCVEGCFCKSGYVRGDNNECVAVDQCQPTPSCWKPFEEYSDCGSACPLTCKNKDDPPVCIQVCESGCFCQEGYVRAPNGFCTKPELCPLDPPPICEANEFYSECGAHGCLNTCEEPNLITFCDPFPGCYPGCICNEGYLRDTNGKCVLAQECSNIVGCPANEEYTACGAYCQRTCGPPTPCAPPELDCYPGCICVAGFVRKDFSGECIPEDQCPLDCRADEVYEECSSFCEEPTCGKEITYCRRKCMPRCFCQEGHVRHPNLVDCVKPDQCPPTCGAFEVYSECGANGCQNTCQNPTLGQVCRGICTAGCVCAEGYLRDENNRCVLASECPATVCSDVNEEYNTCGTACQQTCDNIKRGIALACIDVCVKGCFCKSGYVRGDNNECVPEDQCQPTPSCSLPFEEYSECNAYCPLTCEELKSGFRRACAAPPQDCNPGCVCSAGYLRGYNNECVPEDQCQPTPSCSLPFEEYSECNAGCQKTCEQMKRGIAIACTAECVKGCVCSAGYVRGDNNECVPEDQCQRIPSCKMFEEYTDCGTACPLTCENKNNPPLFCTANCVVGCFCQQGYIRGPNKDCIKPEQCPATLPSCPVNEVYSECGKNSCEKSCLLLTGTVACRPSCAAGCICVEGLVRDYNDVCIPESECPKLEMNV